MLKLTRNAFAGIGITLFMAAVAVAFILLHAPRPTTLSESKASGQPINLLRGTWRYLDGVTQTDNKLLVSPTDLRIVKQDGSGGQSNPPVNLYGTRLQANGDFSVTTHMAANGGTATLRLYNQPPIIADEFRIEPAGIAVSKQGSMLLVQVWDGTTQTDVTNPKPAYSTQLKSSRPDNDITIAHIGGNLIVRSGTELRTASGLGDIFTAGTVWFGLDSPDAEFSVDKLLAQGLNGTRAAAVDTTKHGSVTKAEDGLQALANDLRPGFRIGAAVALGPVVSDADYANQLFDNFGAITLENAMKSQFISPKQGVYTFQEADALIALGHQHGMAVHGHTFAFSEAEPAWMRQLPTATAAERRATTAILLDYVSHVMRHFQGKFDSLDVINEPLDTDQGTDLQENIWYKAMGPDYMAQVSKLVHSIDPNVKQYINENGAEIAGDRQDALLALAQHVNAHGGFIYGIGLQAHVYDMSSDALAASQLHATFQRLGATGLRVRISENDVTDDNGTTAQARQYSTVLDACIKDPVCVSYTTWGVNDRYDWFVDNDGSLQQGHDLLFDGTHPTQAYTALKKLLR